MLHVHIKNNIIRIILSFATSTQDTNCCLFPRRPSVVTNTEVCGLNNNHVMATGEDTAGIGLICDASSNTRGVDREPRRM